MNLSDPGFFITYSLLLTVALLLLIRFIDLYERKPLPVVAAMAAWGGTGAVAIGLAGNGALSRTLLSSPRLNHVFGQSLSAPIVEELGKGVALLGVFVLSGWAAGRFGTMRFDSVNDGIVYGAAVGIGFAFTENVFYFMRSLEGSVALQDALGVFSARLGFLGSSSLGHAVYTGTFGAGIGLANWSATRRWRVAFPFIGFALAVLMHATYNGLGQLILVVRFGLSRVDEYFAALGSSDACPSGFADVCASRAFGIVEALDKAFLAAFFVGLGLWLAYQRRVIREEMIASAEAGIVTPKEAEVLPRYWRRARWYRHVLFHSGVEKLRLLRALHASMVDLAFTKRRSRRDRRPGSELARIAGLEGRIAALRRAAGAP